MLLDLMLKISTPLPEFGTFKMYVDTMIARFSCVSVTHSRISLTVKCSLETLMLYVNDR